jgi:hypothetical protein
MMMETEIATVESGLCADVQPPNKPEARCCPQNLGPSPTPHDFDSPGTFITNPISLLGYRGWRHAYHFSGEGIPDVHQHNRSVFIE